MNPLLKTADVRKYSLLNMDGKAKREEIFTMILFSRKSLLIAISVADLYHFIGWQLVVMTDMSLTVTYKQSSLVLNAIII